MSSRWFGGDQARGDAYDARWDRLEADGVDPHGEAAFVMGFAPTTVLDAGCGTGRVAIELAARGVDAVGFDLDPSMLDTARRKAPGLRWEQGDAATIDLIGDGPGYDVVLLAGNVMIFVERGSEADVLANMARHLAPGGHLVAGFSLVPGGYRTDDLDCDARGAGLALVERWSTWDRRPWSPSDEYAVSVFGREEEAGATEGASTEVLS